jgi:AraC-like DNA-binding protein
LIFGVILLFDKKHPGAGFLATFMFILAYNGFETFNWSVGLDRYYLFFDIFSFITIYGIGPSIYFYITSLLYPERTLSWKQILPHYGLVLFQFVGRIGILVYHILWINKIINTDIHSNTLMGWVLFYAEPLSVLLFIIYLGAAIYQFRRFRSTQHIKSISKEGQQIVYKWIKALLICLGIMGVAWPLTISAPYILNYWDGLHYYPIELGLVLFTYWIAMSGYHRMKLIYVKPKGSSKIVSDSDSEKFLGLLKDSMDKDKLYLDPELNLNKVASQTGISAKTISAILNQYHQTSFNDFINDYRVREVKTRLIDPSLQHLTISGIALECGFNSQATFQRAFKSNTGMSPREYINVSLKKMA